MSSINIEMITQTRQYIHQYREKHCKDPSYIKESKSIVKRYEYLKKNNRSLIEREIINCDVKSNFYSNFFGFKCIPRVTICRANGDTFDVIGLVELLDKDLAKKLKLNCHTAYMSMEAKVVLDDEDEGGGLRNSQNESFNGLIVVFSIGGYHSLFYKDTNCPVVFPRLYTKKIYKKELKWKHGLGDPQELHILTNFLEYAFNNNPVRFGGKRGRRAREIELKKLKTIIRPLSSRTKETVLIYMVNNNEFFCRCPHQKELSNEFYDRVAGKTISLQKDPHYIPGLDFVDPRTDPKYNLGYKRKTNQSIQNQTLFEAVRNGKYITAEDNYILKLNKSKTYLTFNEEIVKRLGIKKKIFVHNDLNGNFHNISGGSFCPATNSSLNTYPQERLFVDNFKINSNYIIKHKSIDRSESDQRMRKIRGKRRKDKNKNNENNRAELNFDLFVK